MAEISVLGWNLPCDLDESVEMLEERAGSIVDILNEHPVNVMCLHLTNNEHLSRTDLPLKVLLEGEKNESRHLFWSSTKGNCDTVELIVTGMNVVDVHKFRLSIPGHKHSLVGVAIVIEIREELVAIVSISLPQGSMYWRARRNGWDRLKRYLNGTLDESVYDYDGADSWTKNVPFKVLSLNSNCRDLNHDQLTLNNSSKFMHGWSDAWITSDFPSFFENTTNYYQITGHHQRTTENVTTPRIGFRFERLFFTTNWFVPNCFGFYGGKPITGHHHRTNVEKSDSQLFCSPCKGLFVSLIFSEENRFIKPINESMVRDKLLKKLKKKTESKSHDQYYNSLSVESSSSSTDEGDDDVKMKRSNNNKRRKVSASNHRRRHHHDKKKRRSLDRDNEYSSSISGEYSGEFEEKHSPSKDTWLTVDDEWVDSGRSNNNDNRLLDRYSFSVSSSESSEDSYHDSTADDRYLSSKERYRRNFAKFGIEEQARLLGRNLNSRMRGRSRYGLADVDSDDNDERKRRMKRKNKKKGISDEQVDVFRSKYDQIDRDQKKHLKKSRRYRDYKQFECDPKGLSKKIFNTGLKMDREGKGNDRYLDRIDTDHKQELRRGERRKLKKDQQEGRKSFGRKHRLRNGDYDDPRKLGRYMFENEPDEYRRKRGDSERDYIDLLKERDMQTEEIEHEYDEMKNIYGNDTGRRKREENSNNSQQRRRQNTNQRQSSRMGKTDQTNNRRNMRNMRNNNGRTHGQSMRRRI